MKFTRILVVILPFMLCSRAWAQTADEYVTQGRAYLSASNLISANSSFASAVALAPSHATANVLYGATRLLVLQSQPAGSNFFTRLGVPVPGRSIYKWAAVPPVDTNNAPLAPAGVNAAESTLFARTNILPQLIAAEANLAVVVDTNFTLGLTSGETAGAAVTLDYGDLQILRALLQGAEYACYAGNTYNIDAQLTAIRSLYDSGQLLAERIARDYPQLLTFTTTNDLAAGRIALQSGVARYFAGSQFIRNRSTNVVRLFNYAPEKAVDEQNFRTTLADLTNSITHLVTLGVYSNVSVYAGSPLSGTRTLRSFLPALRGNGFGLGTLPDPTFGGLVYDTLPGQVEGGVEKFLSQGLFPIPTIASGFAKVGPQFQIPINTQMGRGYVVEVSTNLFNWTVYATFFSFENGYLLLDTDAYNYARRYYRVADRTKSMPAAPNDNFANRIYLTGLGISTIGYNAGATSENYEVGLYGGSALKTVWWSWTAPVSGPVSVATEGSTVRTYAQVYTGTTLSNLVLIAYPGESFFATAGTVYQIQVSGDWTGSGGGITLEITAPPVLSVHSPADGITSLGPTNFNISASATDSDGSISNLRFLADGKLIGSTTSPTLSVTWSNVVEGNHNVLILATDNLGVTTLSNLIVIVRPPNDKFANRITIGGSSATITGSNSGASKEPGEPNHSSAAGGSSVWWSWPAPFSGYVTISADQTSFWGTSGYALLGVYTGNLVSNLTEIASDAASWHPVGAAAQVSFPATSGIEYKIAVDGQYGEQGPITLRVTPTDAPMVSISYPTNGQVLVGPTSLLIVADASDNDGTISRVDFYDNSILVGSSTAYPYFAMRTNQNGGTSHSLVAKATDNMGVASFSEPVNLNINFAETTVSSGIPLSNRMGIKNSTAYYSINVSTNDSGLQVSTYGGSGDCDLYVAHGYQPTLYHYDYRPYMHGNNETVTIYGAEPGDWHIMLNGWDAYSGVILNASTW